MLYPYRKNNIVVNIFPIFHENENHFCIWYIGTYNSNYITNGLVLYIHIYIYFEYIKWFTVKLKNLQ